MAKNAATKARRGKPPVTTGSEQPAAAAPTILPAYSPYLPYLIIFLFSTGIYFNTLWDKYALDDTAVLTANKYTKAGFGGIKDIMTHDALVGFLGENGATAEGGRYRPLSMVTLAIEVGLFGQNPMVSHAVNVLLFTLTCLLLYQLLTLLLPLRRGTAFYLQLPFITTMLFAGHPIHTEAVANIKGRDEIMGLLFSLLALWAAVKYARSQKFTYLMWAAAVYFLALLSKENTVTFIAVIPLTLYFFTRARGKDLMYPAGICLIPLGIFLLMRQHYTRSVSGPASSMVFNDPFVYLPQTMTGYMERYATIIKTFLLYVRLLILPQPLTHDYIYNEIPVIGISDIWFLLSVIVNGAAIIYALRGFARKSLPSFAILYYFITFSIVSNVVFNIGSLLSERAVYMPSVGFCLLTASLLVAAKDKYKLPANALAGAMMVILILYSVKTISRNTDWSDDLTLFLVDAKTSANSARVQNGAGSLLFDVSGANTDSLRRGGQLQHIVDLLDLNEDIARVPDSVIRRQLLSSAVQKLYRAVIIYPDFGNGWYILGNASYKLNKDPQEAIKYYQKAIDLGGGREYQISALNNAGSIELEHQMPVLAKNTFIRALRIKPNDPAFRYNLALAYSVMGASDSALYWYNKALEVKSDDAVVYFRMGMIYGKDLHDLDMAIRYMSKAIETDPGIPDFYENLALAYNMKGAPDDAIRVAEQCLKRFPADMPSYMNMATSYRKKNDLPKAQEYEAKAAMMRRRR